MNKYLLNLGICALMLFALAICAGCNAAANLFDEAQMQVDLLMYGEEAKEYYAETLNKRELFEEKKPELMKLIAEAREQTEQNDRTPLENPATWKFLWLNCHSVEYMGDTYKISEKQLKYSQDSADSFVRLLEDAGEGNIVVECDVESINHLMHASLSSIEDSHSEGAALNFLDTEAELMEFGIPGNYDAVLFITPLPAEVTHYAGRCSGDINMGYGYMNVILTPDELIGNEYAERYPTLQSATVALHELIHALDGYNVMFGLDAIPNPDEAAKHSIYKTYTGDSSLLSFEFYDDVLRGKVKMADDRYLGMYPKMWRITPRYLTEIGASDYLNKNID